MEAHKCGCHAVGDSKYLPVWARKYRYATLGGDVVNRCRELSCETAQAHEMIIHAGSVNRDHVHMLVSIPRTSRTVRRMKGRSSHKLLSEFWILRKRYWIEPR